MRREVSDDVIRVLLKLQLTTLDQLKGVTSGDSNGFMETMREFTTESVKSMTNNDFDQVLAEMAKVRECKTRLGGRIQAISRVQSLRVSLSGGRGIPAIVQNTVGSVNVANGEQKGVVKVKRSATN